MKPLRLLSVVLLPVFTGLIAVNATSRHYQHKLDDARSAYKLSSELAPVQMTTMAMTRTGSSNFFYLVIGEKAGVQTAAVIRSNSVAFNVPMNALEPAKAISHRL